MYVLVRPREDLVFFFVPFELGEEVGFLVKVS